MDLILARKLFPPATIVDVARMAHVSTATVSRVVNGSDNVSAKTVAAVKRALKACQYQPNVDAIRLRRLRRIGGENPIQRRRDLAEIDNGSTPPEQ
jgi:DNA-binding transcriptional regulator YdaS (Cro superfamily)